MKLPPPNVEASARGMVKHFGTKAAMEAREMAVRFAKRKDPEGHATWLAIEAAIGTLAESSQVRALGSVSSSSKRNSPESRGQLSRAGEG